MNAEQLESLLIDQSLGELPEDVSALLEAYLAQHPEQAARLPDFREAIAATETAVAERSELFRCSSSDVSDGKSDVHRPLPWSRFSFPAGKWAAAFVALSLAAGSGFFLGRQESRPSEGIVVDRNGERNETAPPESSPWARYQVRENGRLAVVPSFQPRS